MEKGCMKYDVVNSSNRKFPGKKQTKVLKALLDKKQNLFAPIRRKYDRQRAFDRFWVFDFNISQQPSIGEIFTQVQRCGAMDWDTERITISSERYP